MRRVLLSIAVMSAVALALTVGVALANGGGRADAAGGGSEKVTLCHIPPDNPSAAHTITVGAPAVDAHLAHGDTLGPCPAPYP